MLRFAVAGCAWVLLLTFTNTAKAETGAVPPKPNETFRDCPDCPEMVWLPVGRFTMGGGDNPQGEPPRHAVTVSAVFAIGKYQVTRGEYARFAQATGRRDDTGCYTWAGSRFELDGGRSWRNPGFNPVFPQTDRDPAVCVSWNDAKAYATWLSQTTGKSYRLPSEAEWEYAARGGSETGEDVNAMCRYATGASLSAREKAPDWIVAPCRDPDIFTKPVDSFQPNPFGLYGMLGNAWQWTGDCWNDNYANAPSDSSIPLASGECSLRVVRGGSRHLNPFGARVGFRSRGDTGNRFDNAGFRVARAQ